MTDQHAQPRHGSNSGPSSPARRSGKDRESFSWTTVIRNLLAGLGLIVGLGVFVIASAFFGQMIWPYLQRLPIWSETYGSIYVESPEVYTRERLVNDRYTQDYWLRRQLDQLDRSTNLIDERRWDLLQAAIGTGLDANEFADKAIGGELVEPSFATAFELRTAIRDSIRQMILENLLDDRHDIFGNSVYGLKFDTAVIPGNNTHTQPFVRVRLPINPLKETFDKLLGYSFDEIDQDKENAFYGITQQYESWIGNVQLRLNKYISSRYKKRCTKLQNKFPKTLLYKIDDAERKDSIALIRDLSIDIVSEAVKEVLSVDIIFSREYIMSSEELSGIINLPSPWGDYFVLQSNIPQPDVEGGSCDTPIINLRRNFVTYFLFEQKTWDSIKNNPAGLRTVLTIKNGDQRKVVEKFSRFFVEVARQPNLENETGLSGVLGEGTPSGIVITAQLFSRSEDLSSDKLGGIIEKNIPPVSLGATELKEMLRNRQSKEHCINKIDPEGETELTVTDEDCVQSEARMRQVVIDWGLTNFVRALSAFDAYAYAAFPRQDVSGVLSQYSKQATFKSPGGDSVPSSGVSVAAGGQAARAVPTLVSYADGRMLQLDSQKRAIEFGWLIATSELAEPVRKSQLVLVSVPSYFDSVSLEVTTGWLDAAGNENPDEEESFLMNVPLPQDFEVFDRIVIKGGARPGPIIHEPETPIVVRACTGAQILIRGTRLWRSTSVVLGGQPADRIIVLPDMQGLVATFLRVQPPTAYLTHSYDEIEDSTVNAIDEWFGPPTNHHLVETELSLWTSEDSAALDVYVAVPHSGTCDADSIGADDRADVPVKPPP